MLPWFTRQFGNPASRSHVFGWKASEAVEMAREQVAGLIHADAKDIIFTSGATEGLNLAIKGLAEALSVRGKHIICGSTEHHAVLDCLQWLKRKGFEITMVPVNASGLLDIDHLKASFRNDTIMAIVMWANNETGVIQDIPTIGPLCQEAGIPLISDITQAAGKMAVDVKRSTVGIAVCSSHKMYGPKGAGAVYINTSLVKTKPLPLIHGGGHERGLRSGTLNVPGIVGFGMAAHRRQTRMQEEQTMLRHLRDDFEKAMLTSIEAVKVNGDPLSRLPTVSNLLVRHVDSQAVMSRLRSRLAISSGSACSSADTEPSHVLQAMGLTLAEAKSSFRISVGIPATFSQVKQAAEMLQEAVGEERAQSPLWQMYQQGIDLDG